MTSQTPPGWYPDGHGNTRFWNGTAWVEQQPAATTSKQASGRPWWKAAWVIPVAVGLVAFGIGAAAGAGGGKTRNVAGPTQTATATVSTTETQTATPTVIKTVATHIRTQTIRITTGVPIPNSKSYGSGTYVVGQQIQPGTYQTTGADLCGWETDTDLAGQNQDGFDTAENGPLTAVVTSGDKLFKVIGDCTFHRLS